MIKFIKNTAWAIYLAGGLSYLGYGITTAEWWAIFIPVTILEIFKEGKKDA